MAIQNRYKLLSKAVLIANSSRYSFPLRLKMLADLLSDSLEFKSASWYIIDRESRYLVQRISSGRFSPISRCSIPVGEGIAGRCAAEKAILYMDGRNCHEEEKLANQDAAWIAALPVQENDRLSGVLTLGMGKREEPAEDDLEFLQDILVQSAGLILKMNISEISSGRMRNLSILNQLGQLLNRSIPLSSLLPLVLQKCYDMTDSSCIILRLIHGSGLPVGTYKKSSRKLKDHLSSLIDMESVSSERVLQHGIPLITRDIAENGVPQSFICVPLKYEERLLGSLTFFSSDSGKHGNYQEEDRELFECIAMIISNALAGAANYQQLARLSIENEKKLKEGFLLYRVSNTMLSTIRLNKLIHLILTALTSGASPFFDRAMLFLINQRAGIMQGMLGVTRETAQGLINPVAELEDIQAARWDISEEDMILQRDSDFSRRVRATRLELNRSLNVASRAVLDKKTIYIPDVGKEKRVDRNFVREFNISSFAVAPLMAKEQVVGVVVVDNALGYKSISRDDLRFLQLFTNQAGMAIENSMLYNRIEDTNRSLREAQERLIQGERLATIGEMAAGIAHELKTPLISIGGFARRLEKKLSHGTAEQEYADTIIREVQRLEKMLSDILSFTKKTTICYTHCNIIEIIEDSLAIVALALEESRINVVRRFPRNPITFLGDCQQLKQVFINLFFNAQEAMKKGGQISVVMAPAKLNGRNAVSVRVADSGGGIPLEALHNIFNPFYTTKETGTGLGLPIANRIVTNHGGKIQVNNRLGEGVEFNVILPCTQN